MRNFKSIASVSVSAIAVASTCWFASFAHPNLVGVEIVPEWNGPDLKVKYECGGSFVKMKDIDMQRDGDIITVNYGALGRRRGGRTFKCNAPISSVGAGSR